MKNIDYFWGYSEPLEGLEIIHLPDDHRRVAFITVIHEELRSDLFAQGFFSCLGHYLVQDAKSYCWIFETESQAFSFARLKMNVVSFYYPPMISDELREATRHAL